MFVNKGEWKKLEDELLADKALINRMNRPKGGLDHYYHQVNNSGYDIRFNLALDGIYQPEKIEWLNEVILGVGNIKFIDPMKNSSKEDFFVRRPWNKVVSHNKDFIDGEKVDEEIICERRHVLDTANIDEDYINEFFKRGGPLKEKMKVQNGFKHKNQYLTSISWAIPCSERVYESKECETFDMGKVTHNIRQGGPISQRCVVDQKKSVQNSRALQQRRVIQNIGVRQNVQYKNGQHQNIVVTFRTTIKWFIKIEEINN